MIGKNVRFATKSDVFILPNLQLAILELDGVQTRNVPHFKGLTMLNLDFEAQGRGSSFTFCHGHLKKAILP